MPSQNITSHSRIAARINFKQYETEGALQATIDYLRAAGFNEVMVMNHLGHDEPAHYTPQQIKERVPPMRRAMECLRAEGYVVTINNLSTIGMNLSPPAKHDFGIQPIVDADGQVFSECFCPLDTTFHRYLGGLFATWASLRPDEIWIDDDFRYKSKSGQCFCPHHLARISRLTARQWQREELFAALRDKRKTALQLQWGQLQKDALLEAAQVIADAVHREHPDMPIGMMGIIVSVHHYGTEYVSRLLEIINPGRAPLTRPEFAGYNDLDRLNWSAYWPRWASDRTSATLAIALPEYETWPGTAFNHSYRVLKMKHDLAAAYGFIHAAESVMWQSHLLEPRYPAFQKFMHENYAALAKMFSDASLVPSGVSLELSSDNALHSQGQDYITFHSHAVHLVGRLGLPLWPGGGHAYFLTGNSPLSNLHQWSELAKQGIMLDRTAVDNLIETNNAALIAGAATKPMPGIPVWEYFEDCPENGLAAGKTISLENATARRADLTAVSLPNDPRLRVLSWFQDEDGVSLSPATWLIEDGANRIVALPFGMNDASSQNMTANWLRKSQIEHLLEWGAHRPLPVKTSGAADLMAVYRQSKDGKRIVLALANYSQDDADFFRLEMPLLAQWPNWKLFIWNKNNWESAGITGSGKHVEIENQFSIPTQSVAVLEWTPA